MLKNVKHPILNHLKMDDSAQLVCLQALKNRVISGVRLLNRLKMSSEDFCQVFIALKCLNRLKMPRKNGEIYGEK